MLLPYRRSQWLANVFWDVGPGNIHDYLPRQSAAASLAFLPRLDTERFVPIIESMKAFWFALPGIAVGLVAVVASWTLPDSCVTGPCLGVWQDDHILAAWVAVCGGSFALLAIGLGVAVSMRRSGVDSVTS